MFCFKCGSQQADDAKFCGACGTSLAEVLGPQPEAGVSAAVAPSIAGVPAPLDPPAADASLTVEEWNVTCSPPDDDGNVTVTAKVSADYRGSASAHVARLSWIVFDPSGSVPLLQGDNTLNQDIDNEDIVEVEAGGFGKLGEGVEPDACQVKGQIVLYPGEKQPPWTIPLPEGGHTGGKGPAWPPAGAEVSGWRVSCSESSEESASYTLFILVRNTSVFPLAAVTFRVRVKNRKGDVWSTEHLAIERLAPEEIRGVETSLYVSERVRARKGALIEVVGIACPQEVVCPLAPVAPVPRQPGGALEESYGDEEQPDDEDAVEHAEDDADDETVEVVDKVRMMSGVFEQKRTRYSSRSAFVAVYCPPGLEYDREAIGERVFPDADWGCIDPPGPNAGFGDKGEIGPDLLKKRRIPLSLLKDNGRLGIGKLHMVLKAYMDAFFVVDDKQRVLVQVPFEAFMERVENGDDRDTLELVEYEPD
jgi:hypothetical protein